jgi:hypothetical protein
MTYHKIAYSKIISSQSSITISSIPQWNQDLEIIIFARTDRASNTKSTLGVRFNSDSAANYTYTLFNVQDGQPNGQANSFYNWYNPISGSAETSIRQIAVSGANAANETFGHGKILIPNYSSTTKHKTALIESSSQQGNYVSHGYEGVSTWKNTSQINSVTVFDLNGANLVSGSSVAIYGMG